MFTGLGTGHDLFINSFIPFEQKDLLPATNFVTPYSLYAIYIFNALNINKKYPTPDFKCPQRHFFK